MKTHEQRRISADAVYKWISAENNITENMLAEALGGELAPRMNVRYGRLIRSHSLWEEALNLAFHPDPRVGFRASWALEWAYSHDREVLRPYAGRFLKDFFKCRNQSVIRSYAKMLHDMIRRGIIQPSGNEKQRIAEHCFDLLIDPGIKVAIKLWCIETLCLIRADVEWIDEHLAETIRHHLDDPQCTPAYENHGIKVLKKLSQP